MFPSKRFIHVAGHLGSERDQKGGQPGLSAEDLRIWAHVPFAGHPFVAAHEGGEIPGGCQRHQRPSDEALPRLLRAQLYQRRAPHAKPCAPISGLDTSGKSVQSTP